MNFKTLFLCSVLILCAANIFVFASKTAPVIEKQSWGKITIALNSKTTDYTGDVRLFPTHHEQWDWTKTNTHHSPGVQIADIAAIVDAADIIIITRGMHLVLQVPQATIDYAKNKGKIVHVGQTEAMARLYNQLVKEGKSVGGLFHTTC